ncbi:hypothetical protein XNC3_2970003 [Xenorhabdus nematophila F1]|nr:hypothetical protein XNC3_2970003 [Xenorhabdus nematophila F1]
MVNDAQLNLGLGVNAVDRFRETR